MEVEITEDSEQENGNYDHFFLLSTSKTLREDAQVSQGKMGLSGVSCSLRSFSLAPSTDKTLLQGWGRQG